LGGVLALLLLLPSFALVLSFCGFVGPKPPPARSVMDVQRVFLLSFKRCTRQFSAGTFLLCTTHDLISIPDERMLIVHYLMLLV
jgi:hypothetical protein